MIQNNLFVKHPELVKEWDFNKNNISPKSVLPEVKKNIGGNANTAIVGRHLSNRTKRKEEDTPFCANKKANMDSY